MMLSLFKRNIDEKVKVIFNDKEKTASICGTHYNYQPKCQSIIPISIKKDSEEYIITSILDEAFKEYKNCESVKFLYNSKITTIGKMAFYDSLITNITIHPQLIKIGEKAFIDSCIKKIDIPINSQLQTIETGAFQGSYLESIYIPPLVTEISSNLFSFCHSLTKVKIPINSQIQTIRSKAFFCCGSLKKIWIPPHVTRICYASFAFCHSLHKIEIPWNSQLQVIESCAILYTQIESISIPSNIVELDECWCKATPKLNKIKIISRSEKNIVYYENKLLLGKSDLNSENYDVLHFANRNIKTATIPSFVKTINSFSFEECSQLEYIEIPPNSELETIGYYAFHEILIDSISIPSSIINLKSGWCCSTPKLNNIKILPRSEKNVVYYENKILLGKSDLNSENYDVLHFANRNIQSVTIPPFVKIIDSFSFENCSQLKSIDIPTHSELQIIGDCAFSYTSINKICISNHITKIGENAFFQCRELQRIEISENSELTEIDDRVFNESGIKSIYLPESLRKIKEDTFRDCENLLIIEMGRNISPTIIKCVIYSRSIFNWERKLIIMIPPMFIQSISK